MAPLLFGDTLEIQYIMSINIGCTNIEYCNLHSQVRLWYYIRNIPYLDINPIQKQYSTQKIISKTKNGITFIYMLNNN